MLAAADLAIAVSYGADMDDEQPGSVRRRYPYSHLCNVACNVARYVSGRSVGRARAAADGVRSAVTTEEFLRSLCRRNDPL